MKQIFKKLKIEKRYKIFIEIFLPLFLIITFISGFTIIKFINYNKKKIKQIEKKRVDYITSELTSILDITDRNFENAVNNIKNSKLKEDIDQYALLKELISNFEKNDMYDYLRLYSNRGSIFYSFSDTKEINSIKPLYRILPSSPGAIDSIKKKSISVVVPLYPEGKNRYIAQVGISLKRLFNRSNMKIREQNYGRIVIVSNMRIIYLESKHKRLSFLNKNLKVNLSNSDLKEIYFFPSDVIKNRNGLYIYSTVFISGDFLSHGYIFHGDYSLPGLKGYRPGNTKSLKIISFIPSLKLNLYLTVISLPWIIAYIVLITFVFIFALRFSKALYMKKIAERDIHKFKTVIEASNFGLAICNIKGDIEYINKYFATVHGYSPEELKGKNLTIFHTKEQLKTVEKLNNQLIEKGFYNTEEVWHRDRRGNIFPMLMNGILIKDEENNPRYIAASAVDITDYVETKKQLSHEKESYKKLFELSNDAIFIHDLNGIIKDVNPQACRLTGAEDKSELIGKNIYSFYILEKETPQTQEAIRKLKISGKTRFETVMKKIKGNEELYIEVSAAIIDNDTGTVQQIIRDHTERKIIEKAIKESEKKYKRIVNSLIDVYYRADMKGKLEYISPSVLNYYSASSIDEFIGKDIAKNFYLDPEDRNKFLDKLIKHKKLILYPLTLKKEDGTPIYVETNSQIIYDENGNPAGIEGILRDVTSKVKMQRELEKSEQKYRNIFNAVSDAIAIVDLDNKKIIDINREMEVRFNYSRDELLNMDISKLMPDVDKYNYKNFIKSIRETLNGKIKSFEWLTKGRDNKLMWCDISAQNMRYNGGDNILIVSRNIDERKEIEKKKEEYNKKLEEEVKNRTKELMEINRVLSKEIAKREEAEKERQKILEQFLQAQKMEAIGRLAGGVAHDFNNILTVIMGNAEIMQMKLNNQNTKNEELQEIINASRRAANLTRQLLLFSRKQAMNFEKVNINDLVLNLKKMLIRLIGEDTELVFDLAEDIEPIKGDVGQIEQIILNLVVNARDAIGENGKIVIKTETTDIMDNKIVNGEQIKPGRYVTLSVEDNGTGIKDDIIEKIFEPFFTTKEKGKGTGLGLSAVHGIVTRHEGWMKVDTKIGKGTTFTIYFPASRVISAKNTNITDKTTDKIGNGERILFIEDEDTVRNLVKKILSINGYRVFEANSRDSAIKLFEQEMGRFDLILSDIILPEGDGLSLVEELLERNPDIEVILASGYTDQKVDFERIREKGFKFIHKPFDIQQLLGTISQLLDRKPVATR